VTTRPEPFDWEARLRPWLWRGKIGPAFWTTASVLSLVVNVILIALLIGLGRQLFTLKGMVGDPLINGLHGNFVKMDNANIVSTIMVSDTIQVADTIQVVDTIPVVFDLPLKTRTTVTLVEDTAIDHVIIYLNNAPVDLPLILPQGTRLKIKLDLTVPVSQTVPVKLTVPIDLKVPVNLRVPVNIPLDTTELHEPFVGLRMVVEPYKTILGDLPQSWQELPVCGRLTGWLCDLFFE
jgi:hypothetical protein